MAISPRAALLGALVGAYFLLAGPVADSFTGQGSSQLPGAPPDAEAGLGCVLPRVMGDYYGRVVTEPDPRRDITLVDALWPLRRVAGNFVLHPCSPIDMDCDGDLDVVDGLWVLRWIADLSYSQTDPCPDIGTILK